MRLSQKALLLLTSIFALNPARAQYFSIPTLLYDGNPAGLTNEAIHPKPLYTGEPAFCTLPELMGDLNGDGRPDLIFNTPANTSEVLLQTPERTFNRSRRSYNFSIQGVFDLNGDSYQDVYTASGNRWQGERRITFYRNQAGAMTYVDTIHISTNFGDEYRQYFQFADWDGDSDQDLVYATDSAILIKYNLGGWFGAAQRLVWHGNHPVAGPFRVAQFIAGGQPEILQGLDSLRIIGVRRTGANTYRDSTIHNFGIYTGSGYPLPFFLLQLADIDQNGHQDMLTGDGSLTLQTALGRFRHFTYTDASYSTLVDLNQDGKLDVVKMNRPNYDSLLLYTLDTTRPRRAQFQAKTRICMNGIYNQYKSIFYEDMDDDGLVDILEVMTSLNSTLLSRWHKNLGTFQFAPATEPSLIYDNRSAIGPRSTHNPPNPILSFQGNDVLAGVDYSGDSGFVYHTAQRIVFRKFNGQELVLPLPSPDYLLSTSHLQLHDMNGDGKKDLVAHHIMASWIELKPGAQWRRVLAYNFNGLDSISINNLTISEINGDIYPDRIFKVFASMWDSLGIFPGAPGLRTQPFRMLPYGLDSLWTNLGYSATLRPYDWMRDLDDDGKIDMLMSVLDPYNDAQRGPIIYWLRGHGNGTFEPPAVLIPQRLTAYTSLFMNTHTIGEFTGDSIPDAILVDSAASMVLLKGTGGGNYTRIVMGTNACTRTFGHSYQPGWSFTHNRNYPDYNLAIADFNRDGRMDAITVSTDAAFGSRMFLSTASGGYTAIAKPLGSHYTAEFVQSIVQTGDLNGDGYPDLLIQNKAEQLAFYNRQLTGTTKSIIMQELGLMPNPARNAVMVTGSPGATALLLSVDGRLLSITRLDGEGRGRFALGLLPRGVYLVRSQGTVKRLVAE